MCLKILYNAECSRMSYFFVDMHVIGYSVILLACRFRSLRSRYIKGGVSLGRSKIGLFLKSKFKDGFCVSLLNRIMVNQRNRRVDSSVILMHPDPSDLEFPPSKTTFYAKIKALSRTYRDPEKMTTLPCLLR